MAIVKIRDVSITNLFVSVALPPILSNAGERDIVEGADQFYAEVGKRIRLARSPSGESGKRLSQRELGEAVALTRTSIANIERGRQRILLHTLIDLATALSVKPETLIPDAKQLNSIPSDLKPSELEFVHAVLERPRKKVK